MDIAKRLAYFERKMFRRIFGAKKKKKIIFEEDIIEN